ncbi:MAG: DUF6252 family protein [Lentimicrobium sp.]
MRKIMIISLLSAILYSTSGCKKDKNENDATAVSVKFDGITWTADQSVAVYTTSTGVTSILASSGLSEQVQISFKGNTAGTYNMTSHFDIVYCVFTFKSDNIYSSSMAFDPSGQIIVTKYDQDKKLISGTFHFKGINFDYETKIFTEGVFTNVKFENR